VSISASADLVCREWIALAVLVLAAAAVIVNTQSAVLAVAVPTVVLMASVAWLALRRTRAWSWVVGIAAVAAAMSVAATVMAVRATALHPGGQTDNVRQIVFFCVVVAEISLMVLIALVVRKAPTPLLAAAVVIPVSMALAFWVLPYLYPVTPANAAFAVSVNVVRALAAVGVGMHLRSVDALRIRAVADARRAQRLDLARDLHDFVAHDVSGIVAQAQAAQLIAGHDSGAVLAALGRIEQAGLKALASMDNTVHMLHDADSAEDAGTCAPLPGLTDLVKVADQFSATSLARVALRIDDAALEGTPREVATTAYRIVVESLTNVRRHAATATSVDIIVTDDSNPARPALRVTVTNDSAASPTRITRMHRRGGLGLLGLADRVQALGGTLDAGPHGSAGWRVSAVLPLAGRAGLTS
jgi:signal transduction histidine kinase